MPGAARRSDLSLADAAGDVGGRCCVARAAPLPQALEHGTPMRLVDVAAVLELGPYLADGEPQAADRPQAGAVLAAASPALSLTTAAVLLVGAAVLVGRTGERAVPS